MKKRSKTSTEYEHLDGSYVRIDAYGNVATSPFASANNAHLHKQAGKGKSDEKFNDKGEPSTDPDETHIGMRNPIDLPAVRSRDHGVGKKN